jgi:hypothetical protein
VVELCKAKIKDSRGWASAVNDMLGDESDLKMVDEAWEAVRNRVDVQPDIFDVLRRSFAARSVMLKVPKDSKVEEAAVVLKTALDTYGPKVPRKGRKKKGNK